MSLTYLQNRHNGFDSQWTPERVELLRQLWAEGWSGSQIASKFSDTTFTRCSVIGKARRLKLEPRAPRQPVRRKANGGVPKPPMPPPQPRPPPPPPPLAPQMRQLTFFRLKAHYCHWPLGELLEPARLFCAADADEIYCPFHQRMARARKERDDYNATDDFARSIDECYGEIRARKKNGGKGWGGWE